MEEVQNLLEELKNVHYRDQHAVKLIQEFILAAAGSIGLPTQEIENFENMMIQFREQSGIQNDEFSALAERVESALAKVAEYHNSVLEQISAVGAEITKLDTRLKKLEPK